MTIPNGATILADEAAGQGSQSCRAKLWRTSAGTFGIRVERVQGSSVSMAAEVLDAPSLAALDQLLLFEITRNPDSPPCASVLGSAAAAIDAACVAAA